MTAVQAEPLPPPGKKLCIACKELIPLDATICSHCRSSQGPEKSSWDRTGLKWVAAITAVVGLITGLSGVVGPVKGWWTQGRQAKTMLATALNQEELGEYSAAFDTLSEILKNEPGNTAALHARLDVTMVWLEDTRVPRHNADDYAAQARTQRTRTRGSRSGLGTRCGGCRTSRARQVKSPAWPNSAETLRIALALD